LLANEFLRVKKTKASKSSISYLNLCISPNSKRFYTFSCDQNTPKTKGCLNFLSIQKLELLSSEEISSNYPKHLGCELLSSEEISSNYPKHLGCELLSSEEFSSNYPKYLGCELLSIQLSKTLGM
jgi:hypothetical protein